MKYAKYLIWVYCLCPILQGGRDVGGVYQQRGGWLLWQPRQAKQQRLHSLLSNCSVRFFSVLHFIILYSYIKLSGIVISPQIDWAKTVKNENEQICIFWKFFNWYRQLVLSLQITDKTLQLLENLIDAKNDIC